MQGLKVGLEIHQQLAGKKLFCNCEAEICDKQPDLVIKRKIRAVAGEHGYIDVAAAHEQRKEKHFLYNCYNKYNCLIDIDEEPPQPVNKEALETALVVAKLLNADIVDEIQVMRKTIVDGSNVSGFQRTALIAMNGYIEVEGRKIKIDTIGLEEDAAKVVERNKNHDVYNLSRLGIPLIEIATDASIDSPELAQKAAEKIGMILRSTGKVKRGLGTIRQDVNVSIPLGCRVEIKGAQDLKMMPTLIKNEVMRQLTLVQIKKCIERYKLDKIFIDVTDVMKSCSSKIVQNTLNNNGVIYGVRLEGFNGLLGKELMPGKRLGTELSQYAKVAAGVGGLFHSDELPKYGIEQSHVDSLRTKLGCLDEDAFIIIADQKQKVLIGLEAAFGRAMKVQEGVLREVRNALQDGTTVFLRPMPGAARMYPETDVLPVIADASKLKLPKLISDEKVDLEKLGLSKDLAMLVAKENKAELLQRFVKQFKNLKPAFIAETMMPKLREIKRKYKVDVTGITDDKLEKVFIVLDKGDLPKEALDDVLCDIAKNGKCDFGRYKGISDDELEKILKKIVSENKEANFGKVIGLAMKELRGKADGQKISSMLKKMVK
ncbi:Glu-tRNA(Gln) amidotransferase GatDE subunit E [Candidatus Woesearchaeota archaeon CG10_big_fil_rev_8_21_14_0_10_34_8]|nr:MAG: Glu-tRNA(Gln) amidotransferase GatDE subunit E [Candidatus Woesearchaeota archaeon CG10_big_fil_rev_8_21_14_0_10_34_8]